MVSSAGQKSETRGGYFRIVSQWLGISCFHALTEFIPLTRTIQSRVDLIWMDAVLKCRILIIDRAHHYVLSTPQILWILISPFYPSYPVWRVYPSTGERSSLVSSLEWQGMQHPCFSLFICLSLSISISLYSPYSISFLYPSLYPSIHLFSPSVSSLPLSLSLSTLYPLSASSILIGKYLELIPVVPLVINTISYRTIFVINQIYCGACLYPPVPYH